MSKKKVLCLHDYGCSTGFGQVASNILTRLNNTGLYEFTIIGINYDPAEEIDLDRWPGRIIPAVTVADIQQFDVYGRQKFLNEISKGIYDLVFIIQDTFIIRTIVDEIKQAQNQLPNKFATIFYFPIDATPKKEWIEDCVAKIDFPVPYTNYAKEQSIKVFPEVEPKLTKPIYHGTNLDDFFVIKDRKQVAEFRKDYFQGNADGRFVITNVNRNQPRKDIVRNFSILKELRNRGHKEPLLYLHMAHDDAGGNLLVMADEFGFKLNKDFILPSPRVFSVNQGLPISIINYIYNASDMVLSTTLGEGWGLSITEAMATRTPLVVPDNTSLTEMCADNRAYLIPSGETLSDWFNQGASDNERLRPLMDVDKSVDAIEKIIRGKYPDLDGAQKWAEKYNWDYVCEDWKRVFADASKYQEHLNKQPKKQALSRQQRRAVEREAKKVGV